MKNRIGKVIAILIVCVVLGVSMAMFSACGGDDPYNNGNVKICAKHTGFGTCSVCPSRTTSIKPASANHWTCSSRWARTVCLRPSSAMCAQYASIQTTVHSPLFILAEPRFTWCDAVKIA